VHCAFITGYIHAILYFNALIRGFPHSLLVLGTLCLLYRAHTCFKGVSSFEEKRIGLAIQKRHRRKDPSKSLSTQSTQLVCAICGRRCSAKIGLMSHMRTHNTGSRH